MASLMNKKFLIETTKKTFVATIILSLLIPVALISAPVKKADAAASCIAQLGAMLGIGGASKAVGTVISVPVNPITILTDSAATAASVTGSFVKDCILTPLAINMARTMVRNISNSIVNWINNDFNGKPGFVTDIRGLATDSADEVIGNMIYGSELNFLCSPFSFQIRLALATKYTQPFQEQVRCSLSNVIDNVNNFGNNNGGVGWDQWLKITTEPQNNVYGAYLMADSQLAQNLQTKFDDINNMLNRNGGFLDFQTCDEYESQLEADTRASGGAQNTLSGSSIGNNIAGTPSSFDTFDAGSTQNIDFGNGKSVTVKSSPQIPSFASSPKLTSSQPQCKKMSTKTPGTLVQSQATKVLGGWADQLNLATNIDQIVGALISHFTDKMISGATGFLGLSGSKGYASSNINYAQASALANDDTNPDNSGLKDINTAAQTNIDSTLDAIQVVNAQTELPTTTSSTDSTTNPEDTTNVAPVGGIETLDIVSSGGANRIGRSSVVTLKSFLNTEGNASIPTLEISMQWRNSAVPFSTVLLNGAVGLTQAGITKNFYPQNAPGITFTNVSVGPTYNTAISMSGLSAVGANGQYSLLITAKDATGKVLRAGRLDFIVE